MKRFSCLLLFLITISTYGQDSVRNHFVREGLVKEFGVNEQLDQVDTTISEFYKFSMDGRDMQTSLGNPGLALGTMGFHKPEYGFTLGENEFRTRFAKFDSPKYYSTTIPYARLAYLVGPKKYQEFDLFFTQNISKQLNFSFDLETSGADGTYANQQTSYRHLNFQTNYQSKNKAYGAYFGFGLISGSANENGGIKGDSIYLDRINDVKFDVLVWLDKENLSTNRYDMRNVQLHQYARLYKFNADSNSRGNAGAYIIMNNKGIVEDFWFDNTGIDSLNGSVYYSGFGLNVKPGDTVNDRSHNFGFDNDISLKFLTAKGWDLRIGADIDWYKVETLIHDSEIVSNALTGSIRKLDLSGYVFSGTFNLGMSGYNSEGHQAMVSVHKKFLNNKLTIGAFGETIKNLPSYKFLRYDGSHLGWSNSDFKYIENQEFGVRFSLDSIGFSASSRFYSQTNYTYYGSDLLPAQYGNTISGTEITLEQKFNVKSYHLDVKVIYQGIDESAPVNIPTWVWNVSFYYQRMLFKDALEIRYGVDYWQNSSYTANYYTPFSRSYVLQDQYAVGNYPYLNFYINARVKSAQAFVQFQNLNQIFSEKSYMMVPFYPMQDFGLSFGIQWDFYN